MAHMSPHVSTVFKELFDEIKSAKRQQWTITNYGLLILGAIYGVRHQLPVEVTHLQSKLKFLAILAIATAVLGSGFLLRIQSHMARSRCRLDKLHRTYFTPDELRGIGLIDEEIWPAPGSEDTELGVLMELEVGHGETEVYARVQA